MRIPIETATSYFGDDVEMLLCPVCKDSYTHEGLPEKIDGHDSYKAWQGRGNVVKVPMTCENGHSFSVCLGHHKGNTHIYVEFE